MEKKRGWKNKKDNNSIVGRDLEEQRKGRGKVYEVDESKSDGGYAEGYGGWPQLTTKA